LLTIVNCYKILL